MKQEHSEKGMAWFNAHKDHVQKLIAIAKGSYEPSPDPYHKGGEAGDPCLWKPEHWKWFLQTQEKAK